MNKKVQISESIELGILLALSGGFMDAYSYIGRGGVFANAQTGNMLLLGVHLRKEIFLMRFDTFVRFLLSLSELRSLISFET